MHDAVLIGIGNEFRSDDALGILIVRELRRRSNCSLRIVEQGGEGAALLEAFQDASAVLLIDAVASRDLPGTVQRVDLSCSGVPASLTCASSHAFGVAEAIELARALGRLPKRAILYGIVGENFEPGIGLSDPLVRAIPELLQMIEDDLHTMATGGTFDFLSGFATLGA
jgi:hydrogenase maturation protease